MAHPFEHAQSSAKKFGGRAEDYLLLHNWLDESRPSSPISDIAHFGIMPKASSWRERIFGVVITNSEGTQVPVRYIGEQHVKEDLGRVPTAQDWLLQIRPVRWMYGQRLDPESSGAR